MGTVSRGFRGRRERPSAALPPGQYLVEDFPVLSAGPTPSIDLDDWELTITNETGRQHRWNWAAFRALPSQTVTVDVHCVTHWSKLQTTWEGVPLDTLLDGQPPAAAHGTDVDDQGDGTLTEPRLYQLIRQPDPVGERTFEVTFLDPGVQAYAFTFG